MAQFSFFSFQKSFILSFITTKTRHHHLTHRISRTLRTKPTENYFLPLQLGCKKSDYPYRILLSIVFSIERQEYLVEPCKWANNVNEYES